MDGTIADFYGVDGWLQYLNEQSPVPYIVANPLYKVQELNAIVNMFRACGWRIVVTSWLAKNSSKDFDKEVRNAKREWLDKFDFPYDEIHLVKYGTTKASCTRHRGGFQVLVDDNAQVRKGWTLGDTIDASKDILQPLIKMLQGEIEEVYGL
jgi:hypothetical protein